jgi:hypothetical protein
MSPQLKRWNRASKKLGRLTNGSGRYACEELERRVLLALVVPIYHSLLGATRQLFLDFDGTPAFTFQNGTTYTAHGAGATGTPIPAFTMDADAGNFSATELTTIQQIWTHVAEKYSPFNLDVTTADPGNRTHGLTEQVIIGGSNSDWYGSAGGVSAIGGFANAGLSNSCFAWTSDFVTGTLNWTNDASFYEYFTAETCAHEAAHSFGLVHERSGAAPNTIEYYAGNSLRVPIMGDSSNNQTARGLWWKTNNFPGQNSPDPIQDELAVLSNGTNGFGYRVDDHGGSAAAADPLGGTPNAYASFGVIENALDQDWFSFTPGGSRATFTVRAPAEGAMLHFIASITDSQGNVIASDTGTGSSPVTLFASGLNGTGSYRVVVQGAGEYGDLGQYRITGYVDSFASLIGGALQVNGFAGEASNIVISQSGSDIFVQDNGGLQSFPATSVSSIDVATGAFNDSCSIFSLAAGQPISVNMGAGTDSLQLNGTSSSDTIIVSKLALHSTGVNVSTYSGVESVSIGGAAGDDLFDVSSTASGITYSFTGDNDNDKLIVGALGSNDLAAIQGPITFTGGSGTDEIDLNNQGNSHGFDYVLLDNLLNFTDQTTGGGRTVNYSGVESYVVNGGPGNDRFNMFSSPGPSTVLGGNGDDTFQIGSDLLPASTVGLPFFDGQAGTDTVWVDDQALGGNVAYFIGITSGGSGANTISRSGFSFAYGGSFEGITLTAGSGDNTITLGGDLTLPSGLLNVNAGPGNDTLDFGNGFHITNGGSIVTLDGGSGTNTLNMDSHLSNAGFNENYNITSTTVNEFWGAGPLGSFTYSNFAALNIEADGGQNVFNVANSAAGTNIGINGNGGDDTFKVQGTNGAGQASIRGQLFLTGGNGADALIVDSTADPNGIGYTVDAGAVTPLGSAAIYYSVESLAINTGIGPELFIVAGTSTPTTLNTGGGADVINVTPQGQNLDTLLALLTVNGNSASSVNVNDQMNFNSFTQDILNSTSLTRVGQTGTNLHVATINYSGIGLLTLNTGTLGNIVNVEGTSAPVTINPGPGNGVINVDETSATGPVNIGAGIAIEPVTVNSDGIGAATATFGATQRIGALTIGTGGVAIVPSGGNKVLTTSGLSITGTGKLDLTDQAMIIPYNPRANPFATVQSLVTSGYAAGAWTGAGINSSAAAANAARTTGIGYADNATLGRTSFSGQPVGATSILLCYTLNGDANLDRSVDFLDLAALAQNYNTTGKTFAQGDFNSDGNVDFLDLALLAQRYNTTLAVPGAPVPASLATASPRIGPWHSPQTHPRPAHSHRQQQQTPPNRNPSPSSTPSHRSSSRPSPLQRRPPPCDPSG